MTDNFNPGFFTVDNWFPLRYLRLVRPAAAAVYLILRLHSDRAGRCYPSQERLADLSGLGIRTVQLALKALERHGLVAITRRSDRKAGSYLLYELKTPQSEQDSIAPHPGPSGANTARSKAQDMRPERADSAPPTRNLRHPEGADSAHMNQTQEPDPGKGEPPRADSARLEGPAKASGSPAETSYPPDAQSVACLWERTQTRRPGGRAADPADTVIADMNELLRQGIPVALMRDLILRKSRDRGEYWSTFRARCRNLIASGPRYLFTRKPAGDAPPAPAADQARATVANVAAGFTTVSLGDSLQ